MFALLDVGGGQIILIILLVLIFFGAKKIPELAKGLGQGIKEFKKATKDVTDEVRNSMDDNQYSSPPAKKIEAPKNDTVETASQAEKPSTVPRSAEQKS